MSTVPAPNGAGFPAPEPTTLSTVQAVQHIRRMRGGSQPHLMHCSDGCYYVVKFRNNPQHPRVLANEMLATRLAQRIGLPVPRIAVVEVGHRLVRHDAHLTFQLPSGAVACEHGLQFGSQYAVSPFEGQVFDHLPAEMLGRVRNIGSFWGMLAFDKWVCNVDSRQAAFWRRQRERNYTVAFIDQGHCFGGENWSFPDRPLHGAYFQDEVYAGITGWESFEPWLSALEELKEEVIWNVAQEVPLEWYDADCDGMEKLVSQLIDRREAVRDLLSAFRLSSPEPFRDWRNGG